MECRTGCAACCIAPSISSTIPGMPGGKPPGVRCIQLTPAGRCLLFGSDLRPAVCTNLRPSPEMCGDCSDEAMSNLTQWEQETCPKDL